jgi:hypothetical protein
LRFVRAPFRALRGYRYRASLPTGITQHLEGVTSRDIDLVYF